MITCYEATMQCLLVEQTPYCFSVGPIFWGLYWGVWRRQRMYDASLSRKKKMAKKLRNDYSVRLNKKMYEKQKNRPKKKFKLTKEEIPSPPPIGDDTCSLWSWGSRVSHLSLLGRLLSSWSHKFRKVTCKNPAKTTEVARRKFNTIWFEFKHFSLSITLLVRSRKPGWPLMSLGRLKDRLLVRTVHCLTGRYCRTS